MLAEVFQFFLHPGTTHIHSMIGGAGKNIKPGGNGGVANLPGGIKAGIAGIVKAAAAQHRLLIDNGNIRRLNVLLNILIKGVVIPAAVLLLSGSD